MRAMAMHPPEELPHKAVQGTRLRVYVWDLVVRNTHWAIALSILVLATTGLFIAHPFGHPGTNPSQYFLMGYVKVVHFYAAIVFSIAVLIRIVWLFTSPSLYARWKQFIPVQKYRRRELYNTLKFYSFFRARPPDVIGHNPLAGMSYFGVICLYVVMILTGLAMYAGDRVPGEFMKSFQFLLPLFGGPANARFIHHLVMWILILFVTLHLYAGSLTSALEENGEQDSIFSGFKFVHREDVEQELADEEAAHRG
jgi:Ni/Fe-hydrogenase 1 B-type cytochrome subunit